LHTINAMCFQVIAVHTLIAAWWPKRTPNLLAARILMTIVILYVVLFVAVGVGKFINKGYETPTVRTTLNIMSALHNRHCPCFLLVLVLDRRPLQVSATLWRIRLVLDNSLWLLRGLYPVVFKYPGKSHCRS
jgi:hypothetical protein